jgi:Na+-transporting methylmalonyl-CoA/oxaloacetate decarboxylase beta subunit
MARLEATASRSERLLMASGVVFAVALLIHGADHARRGVGELQPTVLWLGNAQTIGAFVALFLVFTGHRWGPAAAIAIGFASAVGFTAVHLLPDWGPLSDAFPAAAHHTGVTAFSWFAALFEIAADLAFGAAGVYALRRRHAIGAARTQLAASE